MYSNFLWLIVFCGCGVASCITYIVCLLSGERKREKRQPKPSNSTETLVINLDD